MVISLQSTIPLEQIIRLYEDENYMLGLFGFYSDNLIANVNQDLKKAFRFKTEGQDYTFTIFRGQYSIEDIEIRFREALKIYRLYIQ